MIFRTYTVISLSFCLFAATAVVAESAVVDTKEIEKACNTCGNALSVASLCANTATVSCLQSNYASVYDVCAYSVSSEQILSDDVEAQELCANNANVGNLYSNYVQADELCVLKAAINQLCARQLTIESACINDLVHCSPYSARVYLAKNTPYALGSPLVFDTVQYDPSGSISQSPTSFTAPISGTYEITIQLYAGNLTGTSVVLGTPVGGIQFKVNGNSVRETFVPFLTFTPVTKQYATSLLYLDEGDVLTTYLELNVVDPVSGFSPYIGNMTLFGGNPGTTLTPIFYIEYLSSDCNDSTIDCFSSACDTMQCPDTPLSPIVCSAREECAPCLQPCMPCGS